jgi:hypothetical protein
MACAAPSSGETTPARAPPGCPAHHPLDDTFDDGAHISNIESFVVSTVPLVPALDAERPAGETGDDATTETEAGPSSGEADRFALRDLWGSFDEWSAYGVEVPLVLDADDDGAEGDGEVFQYYVPFLSGIQIFVDAPIDDDAGAESKESKKDKDTKKEKPVNTGFGERTRTGEEIPGRSLKFQFMEQASPYSRAPLSDTVARLAETDPELASIRSDDLHPSSWMSVAWYPIYRIPTGRSLRDLSACFLTYHALSTAHGCVQGAEKKKTDEEKAAGEEEEDPRSEAWIDAVGCPSPPPISAHGERVMRTRAEKAASGPAGEGEGEGVSTASASPTPLRAFGLSYYKLRGEMWHAKEVADWLAMMTDGAFSWLKRLKVIHPDFEFFSHHG